MQTEIVTEPATSIEPEKNGHDLPPITESAVETLSPPRNGWNDPSKRIYWTMQECLGIAKHVAPLIKKQGLKLPNKDQDGNWIPSSSLTRWLLPIFQQAMREALPRERWKGLRGWDNICRPRLTLQEVERLLLNVHDGSSKALSNGHAEPAVIVQPIAAISAPAPKPEPLTPTSFAARSDGELLAEFTRRFFSPKADMEQKIADLEEYNKMVSDELAAMARKYEEAERRLHALEVLQKNTDNAVKEKLPTVVLIGLHKYVFEEVKTLYAAAGLPDVNFRLMETGTQPEPFKADYVICQKFVSHSWFGQAQKATPNCLFVDGGAAKIVQKLRLWFE